MKCADVFPIAAVMLIAAMTASAANAAANDTLESCAGSCSTDTAVGIVNVTLVEGPPAFTGLFLTPFDFSGVFSVVSGMLSSALSLLGL
jgi:hypothetical protein